MHISQAIGWHLMIHHVLSVSSTHGEFIIAWIKYAIVLFCLHADVVG